MSQLYALGTYTLQDSYCSHGNFTAGGEQMSGKEGVEAIAAILAKQVLCRHDIKNINSIYRMIRTESNDQVVGMLKKKIEKLHQETLKFQNGIFQQVNRLGTQLLRRVNWNQILDHSNKTQNSQSDYAASALISLYQLRRVKVEGLDTAQRFKEGRASFLEKNPQHIDVLAALLPCCYSGQQFERDRRALLGNPPEKSACEIADRGLDWMLEAIFLKEEIDLKRAQLAQEPHPAYFELLLQKGYLKLFDYLREIQKFHEDAAGKQNYIGAMPFSQISQVILETRDAIIQSVEEAINSLPVQQVVFLVGLTGAGKSTAFCYLRGDPMRRNGDQFQSEQDPNLIFDGGQSGTFFPNTALVDDMLLVDFPGFEDTNGPCIALGVELALKALVGRYPAKLLILGELIAVDMARATALNELRERLVRLFQNYADCVVGITKYTPEGNFKEIAHQQEMLRREEERLHDERLKRSAEEEKLLKQIKTLEAYSKTDDSGLQEILSDTQKRLQTLREVQSNPSSPLMQECRKKIAEREPLLRKSEDTLLRKLGGSPENSRFIRFEDVSDPKAREGHLAALREAKTITVEASHSMDARHREYLQKRFQDQLDDEILSKPNYDLSNGTAEFQTFVLTTSLVNALTLNANPEIGQLLHLPEINRELVDGFDREIVESCTQLLIERLVLDLKIPDWEEWLQDRYTVKYVSKQQRDKVENLIENLKQTIADHNSDIPAQSTEDPFKRIKERYLNRRRLREAREGAYVDIEKRFVWVFRRFLDATKLILFTPANYPSDEFADRLIDNLHIAQITISSLRQLAFLVEKRGNFAQLFQSWAEIDWQEQSCDVIIQTKIGELEEVYGSEKWQKRVTDLRLHCPQYDPEQQLHLLGSICMLMNERIRFVVIENEGIIPALEAKAEKHHYLFSVRRAGSRALILVDLNHYPLLIFDIFAESLKSDPKSQLKAPIFVELTTACTGKAIDVNPSTDSTRRIFRRIERTMQQLANTIQEEISQGQNTTAATMMMSMRRLIALTQLKLEQDSLRIFSTEEEPDSYFLEIFREQIKWKSPLGKAQYNGTAIPSHAGALIASRKSANPRQFGQLLIQLTKLMDMTIFHEITQFAGDFLQMDIRTPLFRALLVGAYLEQAGLQKE